MLESVVPLDLGVLWEPNAPNAVLVSDDTGFARLTVRAHFHDPDDRDVTFVWSGVQSSKFGPYNDEGMVSHPLYASGLREILWAGEVLDSAWRSEVACAVYRVSERHFVVKTKDAIVEVLADALTVERTSARR